MSNGQQHAEHDQAGHDDGGEAIHDLSEPTVISHGATLSYRKIAEGAEVERGEDAAKAAQLDAIISLGMDRARELYGVASPQTTIRALATLLLESGGVVSPGLLRRGRVDIRALADGEQLRGKRK